MRMLYLCKWKTMNIVSIRKMNFRLQNLKKIYSICDTRQHLGILKTSFCLHSVCTSIALRNQDRKIVLPRWKSCAAADAQIFFRRREFQSIINYQLSTNNMINIKAQQTLVKFNKTDAGTLRYLMRPEKYSNLTEALFWFFLWKFREIDYLCH